MGDADKADEKPDDKANGKVDAKVDAKGPPADVEEAGADAPPRRTTSGEPARRVVPALRRPSPAERTGYVRRKY